MPENRKMNGTTVGEEKRRGQIDGERSLSGEYWSSRFQGVCKYFGKTRQVCSPALITPCLVGMQAWLVASVMSNSATPWTVACQAPLSMKFPRQDYWSGFAFP